MKHDIHEKNRYENFKHHLLAPEHPISPHTLLQRAAQLWPEKPALICLDETINFIDLYHKASALSFELQKKGLTAGDRVIILFENSINFFIAYHGAWQTGAVVTPLNTFLHEKEIEHIKQDAQPHTILVSDKLYEKFTSLFAASTCLIINETTLTLIIQTQPTSTYAPAQPPLNTLAALLYTSGTTGFPKGVMLSGHNIMINCIQGMSRFASRFDDKAYCALPLFHSFTQNACVWSSLILGITVILIPKIDRKMLLAGLEHKPTFMLGIPGLYGLFCLLKTANFSSVRYFVCGGDALPNKIRMHFELLYGRKLCNGYGLSETAPFISVDLDDTRSSTNTIGVPFIDIHVELRDEAGNAVSKSSVGTLWVKGPNVMLGYYNAPELTAQTIVNSWFNTGDLVTIHTDGKLEIVGREKDLIKHKGIKIYPQEIENCLMQHPQVTAVGVIGASIESDGEIPVAYVATREPSKDLEDELKLLCHNNLASYKVPRVFILQKEIPLTSTGKVNKKELRILYAKHTKA